MQLQSETVSIFKDFIRPYNIVQSPAGQSVVFDVTGEDSFEEKKKGKKRNIALVSLGTAALLTGLGFLGKAKFGRPIQTLGLNVSNFFSEKADKMNNGIVRGFFEGISRAFGFVGNFIKNTFPNGNNAKDAVAKKMYRENPFKKITIKFDEITSGLYKKLGIQTVEKQYLKTQKLFDQADNLILETLEKKSAEAAGNTALLGQIEKAKQLIQKRKDALQELIGTTAVKNQKGKEVVSSKHFRERFLRLENGWSDLDERAWQEICEQVLPKKGGKLSNFFKKFISEDMVAPEKAIIQSNLAKSKNAITRNLDDVRFELRGEINRLRTMIDLKDQPSWDALINLEKSLKVVDDKLDYDTISQAANSLKECVDRTQRNGFTEALNNGFKSLQEILSRNKNNDRGYSEDLRDALKKIFENDQSTVNGDIRSVTRKAKDALSKAVNMEGNDLVDKMRDVQIGAAPTDFITLMSSTGLMGLYLAQADTNEERVSGTLTKGVPLMTTLVTSMMMAAKMKSGAQAMAISGAAGLAANAIGTAADKIYKQKRNVDDTKYTLPGFKDVREELPDVFSIKGLGVIGTEVDTKSPHLV